MRKILAKIAPDCPATCDAHDLWVTANFKETQLRRIPPRPARSREGRRARRALRRPGRERRRGYRRARQRLPENATGNYVKVVQRLPVRIRLDGGQAGLEQLRPGMSVEPKVFLK